ncbi:Helix-turn-helix domain-containing protein [Actinomadura mexicana]|uniref:Helix-turn-helix domain-containing protein n=2 Tax=Actinomadura mexicana TaxID=134959 RepID=A0A239FF62_9ACTN|nr:Helix-turn-helix domain-containing protein [Actinomadura mexicana]
MMAEELAKRIHYSRMKISRLENAHGRPDVSDVIQILDALDITDARWEEIVRLAHQAAIKGWWDRYGEAMGARHRLYADIESGAGSIREYNLSAIPGILQTAEHTACLIELAKKEGQLDFQPEKMMEARLKRQEVLLRQDGPTYEFVIDEVIVRRRTVPRAIMAAQLRHMVKVVTAEPRFSLRVLPTHADMEGSLLPKATFALYTFPDPADPPMAVVDTITTDLIHTERLEVKRYIQRYEDLTRGALAPQDSLALLTEAADLLINEAGPPA